MFQRTIARASARNQLVGDTGRQYQFKQLLQERPHLGQVWLAKSGRDQFILKDIPQDIFSNFIERIQPRLNGSRYLRLPCDSIPGERIFVYRYLKNDLLSLVKQGIPIHARKQILKAVLLGIAELHDKDIVHLGICTINPEIYTLTMQDIKPDNIMIDSHNDSDNQKIIIERVQLIDLENTAYLPPGRCIKGMLAGNDNWRSPEAHFKAALNKPTDIFSFGIVCIYAMLNRVIFGVDDDFKKHHAQGVLPTLIRLQRQVSYFGDRDGINGLLGHISDDEISCQVLRMLWDGRFEENIPYRSFFGPQSESYMDEVFMDLVKGLTNLDPKRRFTVGEALEHEWFNN